MRPTAELTPLSAEMTSGTAVSDTAKMKRF